MRWGSSRTTGERTDVAASRELFERGKQPLNFCNSESYCRNNEPSIRLLGCQDGLAVAVLSWRLSFLPTFLSITNCEGRESGDRQIAVISKQDLRCSLWNADNPNWSAAVNVGLKKEGATRVILLAYECLATGRGHGGPSLRIVAVPLLMDQGDHCYFRPEVSEVMTNSSAKDSLSVLEKGIFLPHPKSILPALTLCL